MHTRGVKRKLSDWGEEEIVMDGHLALHVDTYPFVRQSLLNLSLEKFNKGRMMVEPSLRRYVLIANTVRIIQEEIRRENPCLIPVVDVGAPGAYDQPPRDTVNLSVVMENRFPFLPEDLENVQIPSVEDDFVSAAIANILKELENVLDEGCPQNLQRLSGNQNPETKVSFVLNPCLPSPQPVQPQSDCVETVNEERGGVTMFDSSSEPKEDSKEVELSDLVLSAACVETLPELPVAMDSSLLEEVSTAAYSDSTIPEAPVPMDTSLSKEVPSEIQAELQQTSTSLTEELKPRDSVFGSFEIMSSSYLSDVSFDDPFSDIDTTVFEKEAPSLPGSISRLSSAEDTCFSSSCNSPSFTSSQGIRDVNDLENIIEILVGS
ncbi:uncharacterized protein WCC33_015670 [Rhinophrynus dorsalis]